MPTFSTQSKKDDLQLRHKRRLKSSGNKINNGVHIGSPLKLEWWTAMIIRIKFNQNFHPDCTSLILAVV